MLASGVVAGVLGGWLLGGRLTRLTSFELAWWPVLTLAIVLRLAAPFIGESLLVWIASFAAIGVVALVNRRVPGMSLIALGCLLNLAVVAANSAMPVDAGATDFAEVEMPIDGLHRYMRPDDVLTLFADRIPVPPIHRVYSPGDIILALGGFWVPFAWMRRR